MHGLRLCVIVMVAALALPGSTGAIADDAFRLDIELPEARKRLAIYAVEDLAVGDRAYIHIGGATCGTVDGTLRLDGQTTTVKPNEFGVFWEVAIKPGKQASLALWSASKLGARDRHYKRILVTLAGFMPCAEFVRLRGLDLSSLITITDIDGHASLAALVKRVTEGVAPRGTK